MMLLPSMSSSRPPEPTSDSDAELDELNEALRLLAAAFPNIRPEVFREMLQILSKESRAQVVAEHLLRNGAKWVKGRWRFPAQETSSRILQEVYELGPEGGFGVGRGSTLTNTQEGDGEEEFVLLMEMFRTESYKTAVYTAFRQEFKSLSRSTILGVLAEQNHYYTSSRPILIGLAAKSWRISIASIFSHFRRGSSSKGLADEEHYMLQWTPGSSTDHSLKTPHLRYTGDQELDEELQKTVLQPVVDRRNAKQDAISLELALLLNEKEAEEHGATYECQVCYSDAAFEQMAICTSVDEGHVICFDCIQRGMSEAIYGQSWDLTIDHQRGQMACIAPTSEVCSGCIPRLLAQRAVRAGKGGIQVWQQFESRLSEEALRKSGATFVQCPFCTYSELDSVYLPSKVVWMLNTRTIFRSLFIFLLGVDVALLIAIASLLPLLLVTLLGLPLLGFRPHVLITDFVKTTFFEAFAIHLRNSQLSRKFSCKNPSCRRPSCLECRKPWRDIHKCHESAVVTLRTTVEAARTAALKRTCPRCGVGFVKDSGCNKMVCVCGYTMCYVCREGLGDKKGTRAPGAEIGNQEQGYRHFCQHFRPLGGHCTECDRCDLYKAEDEDEIVKRAGERAEKEWRERNDIGDDVRIDIDGDESFLDVAIASVRRFTVQGTVNWWVASVFVCKLESQLGVFNENTKS